MAKDDPAVVLFWTIATGVATGAVLAFGGAPWWLVFLVAGLTAAAYRLVVAWRLPR